MTKSIVEAKANELINSSKDLYHQLVLIVGENEVERTSIIQELSRKYNTDPININLYLSKELISLTEKQRISKLSDILVMMVREYSNIVVLNNIEILFDPTIKQDPLKLLQGLSRNLTVVAAWSGTFNDQKLTYAESDHQEYREYNSKDILMVNMNGDTSIDLIH